MKWSRRLDTDKIKKQQEKECTDRRRKAKKSDVSEGDTVLVKRMRKETKLDTQFRETPHTVTERKGGDVVIQNKETGEKLRKNVINLKKVGENWKVLEA